MASNCTHYTTCPARRCDGCDLTDACGGHSCFGTNYVGHVVLTLLLLPALKRETPSRVIAVSSITHTLGAKQASSPPIR
jgi:hypothetical protein